MHHSFLSEVSAALAQRDVASLRYQFPSMERAGRRPDPPALCHATVRAAVAAARDLEPALPLIAGGRTIRRTDDLAGAGARTSSRRSRDRVPVDSRCIRRKNHRSRERTHLTEVSVPMLVLSRVHAMPSRIPGLILQAGCEPIWALAPVSRRSRGRIMPSTFSRARGGHDADMSCARSPMYWRPGSTRFFDRREARRRLSARGPARRAPARPGGSRARTRAK